MSKKIFESLFIIFGFVILGLFFGTATASAKTLSDFGATTNLPSDYTGDFSQNNITNWDPCEGGIRSNLTLEGCFKIDSSVDAQAFWYGEGCLNTGDCTSGKYYASGQPAGSDGGLVMTRNNPFIYSDTKTDDEFGGMQYIYAENYDYNYEGYNTKMTPNGGSSTRKYYWVVLPDRAYSNGLGDTYVATFENLSEPVYFIVFDVHACGDQGESYCSKADADPDGVEAGRELLGAFTKNGGAYQEVANIAGKLTSLCRIKGSGEVLATQDTSNVTLTTSSSGSSSGTSGGAGTTSGKTVAEKIWNWFVKANIPGLSDNPAAIAGIIGSFATEAGGNTIDGLTPFSWSNWGGTLLGCIPQYCGNIKNKVTEAVGKDYFAYKTGVDGIPEEAVDKAIDLELNFMIKDYNNGINWERFIENLGIVSNKTPESYAELFEVIVQNAADPSGDSVQDKGIIDWVASHPEYSTVQQVLSKKRELAREAYEKLAGDNCVDGNSDVLSSVSEIIELANKNGSTYTWGGGHTSDSGVFDAMLNGSPINVDCTGFASLVMYKTYGEMTSFTSSSIFNDPLYKEVSRADVQPGDVFAYESPSGHGGIVIEASNGVVTKIAETGGSEGRSGSNTNIGYSSTGDFSVENMNGPNGHFFRWNGPNNGSKGTSESCSYCDSEESTHPGGFDDVEEADRVVMEPYRALFGHPELWDAKYHLTSDAGPDNCFSFVNYFISMYTSIDDFYGVPGVDGGGLADEFYNIYHSKYPELKKSNTPVAYGVASCGDKFYNGSNYSHTFIVLGVHDNKMIIGEAGYRSGLGYTRAKEFSLTDPSDGSHNGTGGVSCTYVDINAYIKGL